MKESPVTPLHVELGATLGNTDGWNMPDVYTNLVDEHLAARCSCGIFDVSHLSKFRIEGPQALPWLEKMLSNSVAELKSSFAHQTLMLNRQGVIIDKITLARESESQFFIVGSAAQEQTNAHWLQSHIPPQGVDVTNDTDSWCAIALLGPESEAVFHRVFGDMPYPSLYGFERLNVQGDVLYVSRAGVFDSDGVDIYCRAPRGIHWFEALLAVGAIPCGMKTRECLRLEKGIPATQDGLTTLTPSTAGLDPLCCEDKHYMGSEAVQAPLQVARRLVPIRCLHSNAVPSRGDIVLNSQGEDIGSVTQACASPALHLGLAMALIDAAYSSPTTPLIIKCADVAVPAVVVDSRIG